MARKQKMKVYHGLPKSITDEHTIFYSSLENLASSTQSSPIGNTLGGRYEGKFLNIPININHEGDEYTIDFFIKLLNVSTSYSYPYLLELHSQGVAKIGLFRCGTSSPYGVRTIGFEPNYNKGNNQKISLDLNIWTHIRIVKKLDTIKVYKNGVLSTSNKFSAYNSMKIMDVLKLQHADLCLCDLHISNIDRGDYFPNLPQDFIEGKAVIKPRMGQQQIKGDPMYSQVTTLKVSKDFKYHNTPQSDGTYPVVDTPELFIYGQNNWGAGSKLKIKGLNGEILSGVIDTDTALVKVIKALETNHLVVEDISKISVGDQIRACRLLNGLLEPNDKSIYYTVTEIISETSSIKVTEGAKDGWNQPAIDMGYTLGFEITASSSSPIVKTQDGTDVVGTWSGLGTNETTFTLGENTNITGKDLYVTYSLNTPLGNSDFPELPHTIERAYTEEGVEMKPVSEIVIVDDFKGKISGSVKECPNVFKQGGNSSLVDPLSNSLAEISTDRYSQISVQDLVTRDYSVGLTNGDIPQYLMSFNIIDIVERKLGTEISSADKINWIYNNVTVACDIYARGTCPSGNYAQINVYKKLVGWVDPVYNSSSSIQKMSWGNVISDGRIDSNGNIHFLLSTKASDGSTTSTVYLDYVNIVVRLKTDSTYTSLYCENTRAREDKCNPVLIQKETKTVKRYLPSKECFVTECLYYNSGVTMKTQSFIDTDISSSLTTTKNYITTQGTGKYFEGIYKNAISRILNESNFGKSYYLSNETVVSCGDKYGMTINETGMFIYEIGNYVQKPNDPLLPNSLQLPCNNYAHVFYRLLNKDNELILALTVHLFINGKRDNSRFYYCTIPLPNRPLIK